MQRIHLHATRTRVMMMDGSVASQVEGTIPVDLIGTYFRNGPGLQVASDKCQRHTFGEA